MGRQLTDESVAGTLAVISDRSTRRGAKMSGRSVVPPPFGVEVGEEPGVDPAHPVVRVRAPHAVRHVLVGSRGASGGPLVHRQRLSRHRTIAALGMALAFLAAALAPLAVQPATASDGNPSSSRSP